VNDARLTGEITPRETPPHLAAIADKSELILSQWLNHDDVKSILSSHHLEPAMFEDEYAKEVLSYFIQMLEGKQKAGECPATTRLVSFFIEKNITAAEIYGIFTPFRESIVSTLLDTGLLTKDIYKAICLIFNKNFTGVLKEYNATLTNYRKRSDSFQDIIENSLNEIYIFDKESLRFTYANRGAVANSGYSAEEIKTLHPYNIKPYFTRTSFLEFISPLLRHEKERLVFETVHQRKDGTTYDVDIRLQMMRFDHDEHLVAIINDITEQKVAHRLAEDYQLSNAIINNSSDGIVSIDTAQRITMFNPSAERMFGYSCEEIIGQPLETLLPESAKSHHSELVHEFGETHSIQAKMGGSRAEVQGKRRDGSLFPIEASICKSRIGNQMMFTALIRDVSERYAAEAEMRRLAKTDGLTGLSNRHYFDIKLREATAFSRRFSNQKMALLLLDLDRFKPVNDTFGHAVGDSLLQKVASILKSSVREVDIVGRLGGDEFGIIVQGIHNTDDVITVAEKLITEMSRPLKVDENTIQIGVSIGITLCPEQGDNPEQLMGQADSALYAAKDAGRNTYRLYTK